MRIPKSIKDIYEEKQQAYMTLKTFFDDWAKASIENKWHFESRLKQLESFSLKIETGRFNTSNIFNDLYAGMIVVPSYEDIDRVETLLRSKFILVEKKPNSSSFSSTPPDSFAFNDLRLYLKVNKELFVSPTVDYIDDLVFEIQIKTYLQHAWAISTHDLVYKSENISWARHRVAYQVKAILENAELSISSANSLLDNKIINKESKHFKQLSKIVDLINLTWDDEQLPHDKKRLVENISMLISSLDISIPELKKLIATSGCNKLLSISPYQSIIHAVINHGWELIDCLIGKKIKIVVCSEVISDLPNEKKIKLASMNEFYLV